LEQHLITLLSVFLLSLLPTFEGRYSLLYGVAIGLSFNESFVASFAGVLVLSIVLPLILYWIDSYFLTTKHDSLKNLYVKIVERTRRKARPYVKKYGVPGLIIFVAIPFPGTGVWTGSLAAYLFGIEKRHTIISLVIGGLLSMLIIAAAERGYRIIG
jgi:uncharacterized membrane protein